MKTWKYLCAIIVVTSAMMLAGCNTFRGMGKDIEGAGKAIQKASDKTKDAVSK